MYCKLHVLGRVLAITHPGRCIAHLGTCIVLWGGCVSEITLQMLGGIDSVRINTPPPWKKEWLLGVWEREWKQKWIIPFPKFGKGREWEKNIFTNREREGNGKIYSQNSGTGREWKKSIPKFREREGNKKIHSQSSGKGIRGLHSWEWPGTGTGMGIIFYSLFWIFFLLGLPWKFFHWLCAQTWNLSKNLHDHIFVPKFYKLKMRRSELYFQSQ